MDEKQVVFEATSDNPLVVSLTVFRGQKRLDVRRYYTAADGSLAPTKKGVSLPVDSGLAAQVVTALQELLAGA